MPRAGQMSHKAYGLHVTTEDLTVRVAELNPDDKSAVAQAATLRRTAWGDEPRSDTLEHWVALTKAECRPSDGSEPGLPFTLVARDSGGEVIGVVGLALRDPEGLPDRGPWVVGTVVSGRARQKGVGLRLMAELYARRPHPYSPIWVATKNASAFYIRCGYTPLTAEGPILYRD
jgi:GNAT superfamily N-acetyltransferase